MKLYFQNSKGAERFIADVENEKDAMKHINKFCMERGFTIHYTRVWKTKDGTTVVDVSSHTEFFLIKP